MLVLLRCFILSLTVLLVSASVAQAAPVPRTVLCLYGAAQDDPTRAPAWPPDKFSAQILQMALQWMGYEMEFHDAAQGHPARLDDPRVCAVIVDSTLEVSPEDDAFYLNWLLALHARGVKLIFVGSYPGSDAAAHRRLAEALGIRGSLEEIMGVKKAKFRVLDKSVLDAALLTQPRTQGLVSATAPEGAQVYLSLTTVDQREVENHTDVIYSAPWGGVILEPYLFFSTSEEDVRAVFDPFAFLATILPANAFPVPDATTRDGLRMFLSHIDGDGFTTLTRTRPDTTCAEIIRDDFLQKYPFPVTVSVIESEIRALLKDQRPEDRTRFEDIARSILALDQVQGASHAYSHPFVWMPDRDLDGVRGYDRLTLEFADPATYPKFDLRREIAGSVNYIQAMLMPPGKPLEVFLWSGNCRPSGEALRMVGELGLEALNGGNTVVSRRLQGLTAISPHDTFMDGELQIYAPVQNEYVYTNGFTGPLYGGYRQVIETFQRTEQPRRLKAVGVYYHFYSAQSGGSLAALHEVLDWCLAQPLHSVTVRDFVRLAKDARATELTLLAPQRWAAQNAGHCRTFRVPTAWGPPRLAACEGVTGFHAEGAQTYLHTDGRPRVVLDFTKGKSSPRPWLESSTGEVVFQELSDKAIRATVHDLRPCVLVFGGLEKGGDYELELTKIKEKPGKHIVVIDSSGKLTINTASSSSISLVRAR